MIEPGMKMSRQCYFQAKLFSKTVELLLKWPIIAVSA